MDIYTGVDRELTEKIIPLEEYVGSCQGHGRQGLTRSDYISVYIYIPSLL
jgi:hypothetical protein